MGEARRILPSIAEILDRLTIDQIKEVSALQNRTAYACELEQLEKDLDALITSGQIRLTGEWVRLLVALAQINLHIWRLKEQMIEKPSERDKQMKLAHQVNGLRNQIKNQILRLSESENSASHKTNISTDNLEGWSLSILR